MIAFEKVELALLFTMQSNHPLSDIEICYKFGINLLTANKYLMYIFVFSTPSSLAPHPSPLIPHLSSLIPLPPAIFALFSHWHKPCQ